MGGNNNKLERLEYLKQEASKWEQKKLDSDQQRAANIETMKDLHQSVCDIITSTSENKVLLNQMKHGKIVLEQKIRECDEKCKPENIERNNIGATQDINYVAHQEKSVIEQIWTNCEDLAHTAEIYGFEHSETIRNKTKNIISRIEDQERVNAFYPKIMRVRAKFERDITKQQQLIDMSSEEKQTIKEDVALQTKTVSNQETVSHNPHSITIFNSNTSNRNLTNSSDDKKSVYLVDDYADVSTEHPSHMDGDD